MNNNREVLLREIQELQADLEDLTDKELVECRETMLSRVNNCLKALGETDADNNGEVLELAREIRKANTWIDVYEELALLCEYAGLEKEWRESTGETFEDVISRAALILCVDIEGDYINTDLKGMEIISAGNPEGYGANNPEGNVEAILREFDLFLSKKLGVRVKEHGDKTEIIKNPNNVSEETFRKEYAKAYKEFDREYLMYAAY